MTNAGARAYETLVAIAAEQRRGLRAPRRTDAELVAGAALKQLVRDHPALFESARAYVGTCTPSTRPPLAAWLAHERAKERAA